MAVPDGGHEVGGRVGDLGPPLLGQAVDDLDLKPHLLLAVLPHQVSGDGRGDAAAD
jgi:hypothetical protein